MVADTGNGWLCRTSPQDQCSQGADGLDLISSPLETLLFGPLWIFCFLTTSGLYSPLFFKCVFWFLNICLDLSLFSCFQFPFLASDVLLNHSDIHYGFIHKIRKHIQGWKGSIYNCPYNIPVKGTSCLVLIKSIMKCFLPHSRTHSAVREFDRNIFIYWI